MDKFAQLKELKEQLAAYESAVADMDKKISLKEINHDQKPLNVEMFSKKGFHWLNTLNGKAPLMLESTLQEKDKKASKSPKPGKRSASVSKVDDGSAVAGVSVNSVAFF